VDLPVAIGGIDYEVAEEAGTLWQLAVLPAAVLRLGHAARPRRRTADQTPRAAQGRTRAAQASW
jgi:hypothetical protein